MTRRWFPLVMAMVVMPLAAGACGDDAPGRASAGGSSGGSSSSDDATGDSRPGTADTAATGDTTSGEPPQDTGADGDSEPLPPYCGDGQVDPGEQCDDGNLVDHDACTNACSSPACGDEVLQDGEQCDDGNLVETDSCIDCNNAFCGDGFLRDSEMCDDGNFDDHDACVDCIPAACGDGAAYTGREQCDGKDLADATCVTLGFESGTLGCDDACEFDVSDCSDVAPA